MFSTRRRFLSEDDDYDPNAEYEQFEQEDYRDLTKGGQDPTILLNTNASHMQQRTGRGNEFLESEQTEEKLPGSVVAAVGGDTRDKVLKRMDAAQWGTEDPDEDRVTPESVQASTDKGSKPEKPPGPDSPAADYKKPSPFMSDYDARKKAYDEEFGPGKKHKWYSLESTEAWERRRAMSQHDLQSARAEAQDAEYRARDREIRPSGQAMRMRGDQGDGIYQGWTDGSFRKVGGVMDKDAEDKYEPGIVDMGGGALFRTVKGTTRMERMKGRFDESAPNPFLSGAGPIAPETEVPMNKFIAEKANPDDVIPVSKDQDLLMLNKKTGRYERVYSGPGKPESAGRRRGEKSNEDHYDEALKWARTKIEKEMEKDDTTYKDPQTKADWWATRKRQLVKEYLSDYGIEAKFPGDEPPAAGGGAGPKTVKVPKQRPAAGR